MRKTGLFAFCLAFALNGCATTPHSQHGKASLHPGEARVAYLTAKHWPKPGNTIAFYAKAAHVKHPYRIIGKETISRYNLIGLERQNKTVDDLLKNLAASMGGDAVINLKADTQKVEGTVISFEKVIL